MAQVPPMTGFHFTVSFDLFPGSIVDTAFKTVSGLNAMAEFKPIAEQTALIQNNILKTIYTDLVLTRGLPLVSMLSTWCIDVFQFAAYKTSNITITLLDENNVPAMAWSVVNAMPIKRELSTFNAEESNIVIETITLRYDHFKTILPVQTVPTTG
jgi:phage tail-like protein